MTQSAWDYSQFSLIERERANELMHAPSSEELSNLVTSKFELALSSGNLRIGWEQSTQDCAHRRAVLQFHVGAKLYNQFFNSVLGYRGQYKISVADGLKFNSHLVLSIRSLVNESMQPVVRTFEVLPEFSSVSGLIEVTKETLCSSLNPYLSKLWRTDLLIEKSAELTGFSPGITGPKIRLDREIEWSSLLRNEDQAWIEIKGGFLSNNLLYQIKPPGERAEKLHTEGIA
jgi:hypothetical protein